MILINQKWWTVCFCWLSCLQHSCIHHRKTLLWQESFTTCQVRRRTGDLCDSQISDISDGLGHITLEAPRPAPAASINYLLLMLKNVQFPSLLMKSSDAVLKFHDSESFAFRGGVFLPKSRPESITFFLSEQRPAFPAEFRAQLLSSLYM